MTSTRIRIRVVALNAATGVVRIVAADGLLNDKTVLIAAAIYADERSCWTSTSEWIPQR